ncbi:MAG: hypothetical protein ACM3JG_09735, partial [Thiohalocapsa sp.]
GTELGFAAPAAPLGIDLPQIDQAGASAGVTAAALGAGNRGIRWRIDRFGKWLSNDLDNRGQPPRLQDQLGPPAR